MKILLLLCFLLSSVLNLENPEDSLALEKFQEFIIKYNKNYESEEEYMKRFENFKTTLAYIEENKNKVSHEIGINKFADISITEMKEMFPPFDLSGQESLIEKGKLLISKIKQNSINYPKTLDFRNEGKVTPIKNQYPCNSCPIFGTIAMIEAQYKIKTGKLVSFSEQQIYDCTDYHLKCESLIVLARVFQYYNNLKYLYKEDYYKYKVKDNKKNCKTFETAKNTGKNKAIRLNGIDFLAAQPSLTNDPVDSIKQVLNTYQIPVMTLINSNLLLNYKGGIIKNKPEGCAKGNPPDHAVVIVGYGVENDGSTYWIVKNTYGIDWGESGYFRVLAGENLCLIEDIIYLPEVDNLKFYDWCDMDGCIKCSSSNVCSQCSNGYYLEGNTCKKCLNNCLKCSNNQVCSMCDVWRGHYLSGNICNKCSAEYEMCEGQTKFCKDNYYLDLINLNCKKSSIQNCQYSSINNGKETCTLCDDGYGLQVINQQTRCTKCSISNCRTCLFDSQGKEKCQKCIDGYSDPSFSNPKYSSCSKCKDGCNYCLTGDTNYRDDDGFCFNCPENCGKCELYYDTYQGFKITCMNSSRGILINAFIFVLLLSLLF